MQMSDMFVLLPMCTIPKNERVVLKKLGITDHVDFHFFKKALLRQLRPLLREKRMGDNPDIGWCFKGKRTYFCFKSRISAVSCCSPIEFEYER